MPHLPRCGIIVNVWTFGFLLVLELSEVAHFSSFSLTPALSRRAHPCSRIAKAWGLRFFSPRIGAAGP